MANALFARGRQAFLDGEVAWSTSTIKLVLVDHGTDTPVPATDNFLSDIGAGARVATSSAFGSKTVTGGTADAADVTLSTVTGASVESIVIYYDSGSAGTSILLVYIDSATGLPVSPNGGDIIVAWSNSSDKIFTL